MESQNLGNADGSEISGIEVQDEDFIFIVTAEQTRRKVNRLDGFVRERNFNYTCLNQHVNQHRVTTVRITIKYTCCPVAKLRA
jgi:hypothetical protein